MKTSRYVLLSPAVLLEYIYTDPGAPDLLTNTFYRVRNSHTNIGQVPQIAILNLDNQEDITGNVQERSALRSGGATYKYLDADQTPTWLTYDQDVQVTQVAANSQPFDEVRFHIMSGYTFDGIDGLLMSVQATERSGKKLTLCQLAYQKSAAWATFNPRPILVNDRLYDRYVSVMIPSVNLIQQAYDALEGSPSQASTFAALISSDGKAFTRDAPLTVNVSEISSTTSQIVGPATYLTFFAGPASTVSVNQADEAAALAAVIQPSTGGDYFEYFATWNGQFIEDYIYQQAGLGNTYSLIHELRVVEQLGGSFVTTAQFQFIQDQDFGEPNLFRPVVRNAATAITYSLDYTAKLWNKRDASQIIRTASYTGYNPKDWGPQLDRIDLLYKPEPQRVYNKVISGPTFTSLSYRPSGGDVVVATTTTVVPVFFDKANVLVSESTLYVGKDGGLSQGSTSYALKGVGEININVDPFDNWYKFQVFQVTDGAPTPVDLGTNVEYSLVFIADDGTKLSYPMATTTGAGDITQGVAAFKIPGEDTAKLLSIAEKKFYLVITGANAGTSSVYWGWFNSPEQLTPAPEPISVSAAEAPSATVNTSDVPQPVQAPATDQTNAGLPTLPSGTKIPAGTKQETIQQLKQTSPGSGSSVATSKSSILSKMKPKAPNKTKDVQAKQSESTLKTKLTGGNT